MVGFRNGRRQRVLGRRRCDRGGGVHRGGSWDARCVRAYAGGDGMRRGTRHAYLGEKVQQRLKEATARGTTLRSLAGRVCIWALQGRVGQSMI